MGISSNSRQTARTIGGWHLTQTTNSNDWIHRSLIRPPLVYDELGNIVSVDDVASPVAFEYNATGQLVAITPANARTGIRREYDAVGNATIEVDLLGNETRYDYDALNRLVRITRPDGSSEQRTYDAAAD